MKAITMWQPWASLMAAGHKQYETRSWDTKYRGPLAIHAAKNTRHLGEARWHELYGKFDWDNLPYGVVVAIAQLESVEFMNTDFIARISDQEYALGEWKVGRWAWYLKDVTPLPKPVPARGFQGLWN